MGRSVRPSNIDGAAGAVDEVARIVARIRARWPKVRIVLCGDSGFCRDDLMAWCEANGVGYAAHWLHLTNRQGGFEKCGLKQIGMYPFNAE